MPAGPAIASGLERHLKRAKQGHSGLAHPPPRMTTLDTPARTADGNVHAILAVLAATAFFTVVDVMMKLVTAHLPVGESIVIRNAVATVLILGYGVATGGLSLPSRPPWRLIGWRMVGEGGSTITFLSALAVMPIADAAGIGQFAPLAITAAAAAFLGEPVGWRRWLATATGLVGVLLIIRPGTTAFSAAGLLVLAAIAFTILRDFATRGIPKSVSTLTLTAMSSVATLGSGFLMWPFETWIVPSSLDLMRLGIAGAFLLGGYVFMVVTMRTGEVSAATPFRYSGMVAALAVGWLIWGEIPDLLSMIGIAIVCAAGLYTLRREQIVRAAPR
ncbi:MAG: DMT family transporter [Hyphomicrobium sp.]